MKGLLRLTAYMQERYAIKQRRDAGALPPWTEDKILQTWKFTNVLREDDYVTRWIRRWIQPHHGHPLVPMHLALARYVNWPATLSDIGYMLRWDTQRVRLMMEARQEDGLKVFTGAFMVRSDAGIGKPEYVAERVLSPLYVSRLLSPEHLRRFKRVADLHVALRAQYGYSDFTAQEVIRDLVHTPPYKGRWPDADTFAALGPGGRRGLNRVLARPRTYHPREEQALQELRLLQDTINRGWGDWFPYLTAHDIQFNLCEFDKYERVRLGEGFPRARFRPEESWHTPK